MKTFIWKDLTVMSYHWHSDGGIVAIANSLERAREIIRSEDGPELTSDALTTEPDLIYDCAATEEVVLYFPNAGCCG